MNKKYNIKRRKEKYKFINDIKLEIGCIKCGYNNNAKALQFDHINPKKKYKNISKMVAQQATYEALINEMTKCQVLCANCHSIKSNKRK